MGVAAKTRAWQQSRISSSIEAILAHSADFSLRRHTGTFSSHFTGWRENLQATQQSRAWNTMHMLGAYPRLPDPSGLRDKHMQRRLYRVCLDTARENGHKQIRPLRPLSTLLALRTRHWEIGPRPPDWYDHFARHIKQIGNLGVSVITTCVLHLY